MNDKVEAIIVLPRDMFYSTDISVTLWIVNMNKTAGTVNGQASYVTAAVKCCLWICARWDSNVEEIVIDQGQERRRRRSLTDEQIAEAKRVYNSWQSTRTHRLYQDVPELCKAV